MLTQMPRVRLRAGKAGAVNAALLSGTDPDGLPVPGIAYGIGLGVL